MKRLLQPLPLTLLALLTTGLVPAASSDDAHHQHAAPASPVPGSSLLPASAARQQYTCAMHPQVRLDDANARCPICGMQLVPVRTADHPTGHEATDTALVLDDRAQALMALRTAPAQYLSLSRQLSLAGRIGYDEQRLRTLTARFPGRIERLYITSAGAHIDTGALLASVYSAELMAEQEALLQTARAARQQGDSTLLNAARQRLRLLDIDNATIDAILAAGRPRQHLPVHAQQAGTVIEQLVREGDYVSTGSPLYRLADLSRVWVLLEAYEQDLAGLTPGVDAEVEIDGLPGSRFNARVTLVEPMLDERRRTARVRLALDNPDGVLRPGMLARARLSLPQPAAVVIPRSAPLLTGRRALVYVRTAEAPATFEPRQVTLGAEVGDYYIVLDGLEAGETLVTEGAFRLDSERQIRGLPSMMAPTGGRGGEHVH